MDSKAKWEFLRLCGGPGVMVYDFEHEGEGYIMTDGTGEGRFIYVAYDVETWAENYEPADGLTAYDDFCTDPTVGPVEDLGVIEAAYRLVGLIATDTSGNPLILTDDERENPRRGFWGTENETYYVTDSGIYCVQSPDLLAVPAGYTKVSSLPAAASKLSDWSCAHLDVSMVPSDRRGC